MKVRPQSLTAISETLMLPLFFRALESKHADPIVKDDLAVELVSRIDFDFSTLEFQIPTQMAAVMRAREFDDLTHTFIAEHPQGNVVNIGCGLDTRFHRVDNGKIEWYELDFPEVIGLRRHFIDETRRYRYIAGSVLDFSWIDELMNKNRPFLFLAEGVFMYLAAKEVKGLVLELKERFAGSILLFDAVSPFHVALGYFHPALIKTCARFTWGIRNGGELENWSADIRLIHESIYFAKPEPRLARWYTLLRLFPHFLKGFRIAQYRLGEKRSPI